MDPETTIKVTFFVLMGVAVAMEVIADVLFKKWANESRNILLIMGLIIYFIGTIIWAFSLRYEMLTKADSFTLMKKCH